MSADNIECIESVKVEIKSVLGDRQLDLNYMTNGASGMDLKVVLDEPVVIKPLARVLVPTGIAVAIPEGYEAQIRPRSGLAIKYGITLLNTPGTIDSDYRGEIKLIVINLGSEDFVVEDGMRLAQMVVSKYAKIETKFVETLDETGRGDGGFGSTGI